MHNVTFWKLSRRPNYETNIDRLYPYSEVPYLGEYKLVKIPVLASNFIDHVDYWGEGRIVTPQGTSGFTNAYNVNHTYQLVSNGPDRDRKIPNRVPVLSYTNCDTSAYIRDNSVMIVTLMGAPINKSCAADIVRIVNGELGQVVVYGFGAGSTEIDNLTTALKAKELYHCINYKLPGYLTGMTLYDGHMAFLNVAMLKDQLYKYVIDGTYDNAIELTKDLEHKGAIKAINEAIQKLLHSNLTADAKLMSYGYKLWISEAKDIVKNNFSSAFTFIFNQDKVKIVNKEYQKALKLAENVGDDKQAWGDGVDSDSEGLSWRFIPVWLNNDVTFKIYNVKSEMYLKLNVNAEEGGDRKALASKTADEDAHRYYLEPYVKDGELVFFIVNYAYRLGLKLGGEVGKDRVLMGHNGDIYGDDRRFRWIITPV